MEIYRESEGIHKIEINILKNESLHTMCSQSTIYTTNTYTIFKCSFMSSDIWLTYHIPKTMLRRLGPNNSMAFRPCRPLWLQANPVSCWACLLNIIVVFLDDNLLRVIHCMNMVSTPIFSFKHYVTNNFMPRYWNVSFSRIKLVILGIWPLNKVWNLIFLT